MNGGSSSSGGSGIDAVFEGEGEDEQDGIEVSGLGHLLGKKEVERVEEGAEEGAGEGEGEGEKEGAGEGEGEGEKEGGEKTCAADRHATMTFETPDLLKKMWNEFTIRSRHLNYNKPLKQLVGEGGAAGEEDIVVSETATVNSMNVEVPELSFNLDTEQFFTTLDVIRHVLLAPPPPKREYEVVDFERGRGRKAGESGGERESMAGGVQRRAELRRESSVRGVMGLGGEEGDARKLFWDGVRKNVEKLDVGTKRGR